jgi:hypothetical protein
MHAVTSGQSSEFSIVEGFSYIIQAGELIQIADKDFAAFFCRFVWASPKSCDYLPGHQGRNHVVVWTGNTMNYLVTAASWRRLILQPNFANS